MLRNFDDAIDLAQTRTVTVRTPVQQVEQTVSVLPRSEAVAYVAKSAEHWSWDDLRDYVVGAIEHRFGPFPRNAVKEAGIFKSFIARYPEHAPAIARYAFETVGGYWMGAPIAITRFCKASDVYFAGPILARLQDTSQPVVAW